MKVTTIFAPQMAVQSYFLTEIGFQLHFQGTFFNFPGITLDNDMITLNVCKVDFNLCNNKKRDINEYRIEHK